MPTFARNTNVSAPLANRDHCLISANLLFRRKKEPTFIRTVWNYEKANFDSFREKLFECNWDACFDSDDIDSICENQMNTFLSVTKDCTPSKRCDN